MLKSKIINNVYMLSRLLICYVEALTWPSIACISQHIIQNVNMLTRLMIQLLEAASQGHESQDKSQGTTYTVSNTLIH